MLLGVVACQLGMRREKIMSKHKKLWKKPKVIIIDIGKCKYCKEDMTNQESFVAFYPKGKAHYKCMREDDRKNS